MAGADPVLSLAREAGSAAKRASERLGAGALIGPEGRAPSAGVTAAGPSDLAEALVARNDEILRTLAELRRSIETLRRTAELLERERIKYLDLFGSAPDAYIVTDCKGLIEEANAAAGVLLRTDPSFFVRRNLVTFVARQDTRRFREFLRRLLEDDSGDEDRLSTVLCMRPRGQAALVIRAKGTLILGVSGPIAIRWTLRLEQAMAAVDSR